MFARKPNQTPQKTPFEVRFMVKGVLWYFKGEILGILKGAVVLE
jgi:hypothetical protein